MYLFACICIYGIYVFMCVGGCMGGAATDNQCVKTRDAAKSYSDCPPLGMICHQMWVVPRSRTLNSYAYIC